MTKLDFLRVRRVDFVLLAIILGVTLFYANTLLNFSSPPFEDAAMLMRYAEHTANGQGVVWNIGQEPVDGATDFLFMIFVAGLIKVGLTVEGSVRLISVVSHILTVLIIYFGIKNLYARSTILAFVAALILAIGPGLNYIAAYFGTPTFALFATLSWFLALKIMKGDSRGFVAVMFSVSALIMSLVRPEGLFFAIFALIAIAFFLGLKKARDIIWYFFLFFSIGGSLYFFWRWNYFGFPLPNPFYRKSQGVLHPNALIVSIEHTFLLTAAVLWLWLLPVKNKILTKWKLATLLPILGFTGIWVLISGEMNYMLRFQYIVLPTALLSFPLFAKPAFKRWLKPRFNKNARYLLVGLILFVILGLSQYWQSGQAKYRLAPRDGRYDIALKLQKYKDQNFTMAITEAGLLPLYSKWRAIDAWGLNDKWIAHNDGLSYSYLEKQKPELMVIHKKATSAVIPNRRSLWLPDPSAWNKMVDVMLEYALNNNYTLAAKYGEVENDTHLYYVAPDFVFREEIITDIVNTEYRWYVTGNIADNYAD